MARINFEPRKVAHYEDAHAVFEGENPDLLQTLGKERMRALVHFNDYECVAFCVLSDYCGNSAVLAYDNLCGDIMGWFGSIGEFCDTVMEEIEEDI